MQVNDVFSVDQNKDFAEALTQGKWPLDEAIRYLKQNMSEQIYHALFPQGSSEWRPVDEDD